MDINVISSEIDGAKLREEKRRNPYHVRCQGGDDSPQLQEAIDRAAKGRTWGGLGEAWGRIFRRS